MATNGSFKFQLYNRTVSGYGVTTTYTHGVEFTWTRTSTNHDGQYPTSTITWTLAPYGSTIQNQSYQCTVAIEGAEVGTGTLQVFNPSNLSGSITGTTVIEHNWNGTKTFSVTLTCNTQTTTQTFTLDTLLVRATALNASNFTDEENPTVFYNNPSGANTELIEAAISFTGATDNIPYREVPKPENGDGYTYIFQLTTAERATLLTQLKYGPTATVRFYIRTTINGKYYWSYVTRTLTFVNYTPTLSPVVTATTNDRTRELTGDSEGNTLIRYYSDVDFSTGAAARKSAYIKSQSVSCDGQIVASNLSTGIIEDAWTGNFEFSVTDNRGYTTKQTVTKTIVPYIKPTCSIQSADIDSYGNLTFTIVGKYFNASFGAVNNTFEVSYDLKENGEALYDKDQPLGVVTPTVDDEGNYTFTYTIANLNYTSQYQLTIYVFDEITPAQSLSTYTVVSRIPIFDWGKNDFKHHTNVYLDNNKTLRSFQADGSDVQILGLNSSNGTVLGWGGYDKSNGDTGVYGNNVRIHTKGNFLVNGRAYGQNKILWNGAYYMNASQSITLSEAISAQPNGIVLVFSLYRDGAAEDVSINSFFVSKKEVELLPNAPHSFFLLINSGFSTLGAKYLYIDDTTISGHETNSTSGSNNNINFANNSFVLRYVIGV